MAIGIMRMFRRYIIILLFIITYSSFGFAAFRKANSDFSVIVKGADKGDYIVLLHGLARTKRSMYKMQNKLHENGFRTINISYPSTKYPIEYLSENIGSIVEQYCIDSDSKIHFVTHSMGGIILRYYYKDNEFSNLGRVVMISPPNHGSEIIDRLKDNWLFKKIMGPAALQLGTDNSSVPNSLMPPDFELGIITGNKTINPIFSRWIKGEDDGKVSVESTKSKNMADFIIVPQNHMFIMMNDEVIEQAIYFISKGEFCKGEEGKEKGKNFTI